MIALTGMVVHNVEHHGDPGLVKSLDHILELKMLPIIINTRCILRMRCEEVQRHVSPIVTLVRIALKYGHEFDDGDPKLFQIRDLFDQSGIGAGSRGMHAGIGIPGEPLDVKFVDDRVRFRPGREIFSPIESSPLSGQDSKRRLFIIGAWLHGALAIKPRREENSFRIRIEKNLFVIEAVEPSNSLP